MKPIPTLLALVLVAASAHAVDAPERGSLILEDNFERTGSANTEDIGEGWTTNSAASAEGRKQVSLDHGALHIATAQGANHGAVVTHAAEFRDGIIEMRFKLGTGDELGVDFADMELQTVHSGHICVVRLTANDVTLTDHKTGPMSAEFYEARVAKKLTP